MKKRALGKSGLEVAPLALGGNVFGWTVDEQTSFELLDVFIEKGFNLIDTADIYSRWVPENQGGESESIIGKWMKRSANRNKVLIATKVGLEMGPNEQGLSKSYILRAVERSLKRLQTSYIDLYQSHQDDPLAPIEETLDAYAQLIREGKVRAIGASNYSAARLEASLTLSQQHLCPSYQSLQPRYNLYDRAEFETGLEPLCRSAGLGVLPYSSLASGFLTGKYRSERDLTKSVRGERTKNYLTERGYRILQALDQVAAKYDATPAQVSLAWLLARPSVTAPIASATSLTQLEELIKGVQLELDSEAVERLNQASAY